MSAGISIGSLFMGGITVGILMGLFMMATVYIIAKKRGYPKHKRSSWSERIKSFFSALPALLSPVILVGGIFSGYFTPTEAAAVAVFYSLIVGIFVYRELKWKDIIRVMTTGIENLGLVMLLFMGTFMETNASILILTPILMPIVTQIGVHPVQFGVIMIFALMIGLLTPPMAICLFLTSKLGGISFQRAFKAVTPYYIGLLVVLLLINVFPQITLAVPKLLLGSSF